MTRPKFIALLAARTQKTASLDEINDAAASGWAGMHAVGASFHEHAEAAWQHYLRTGESVPADEVLAKLQAKLDAQRKRLR